jgi:hypothetical protein
MKVEWISVEDRVPDESVDVQSATGTGRFGWAQNLMRCCWAKWSRGRNCRNRQRSNSHLNSVQRPSRRAFSAPQDEDSNLE